MHFNVETRLKAEVAQGTVVWSQDLVPTHFPWSGSFWTHMEVYAPKRDLYWLFGISWSLVVFNSKRSQLLPEQSCSTLEESSPFHPWSPLLLYSSPKTDPASPEINVKTEMLSKRGYDCHTASNCASQSQSRCSTTYVAVSYWTIKIQPS